MKTFDPKNKKGAHGRYDRPDSRFGDSPRREDSGSFDRNDDAVSAFAKDKRPRISRPGRSDDRDGRGERRSFNPNFTKDNRLREDASRDKPYRKERQDASPYGRREDDRYAKGDRPRRDDRPDRDDRPANRDDRPWKREDRPDRDSRPWKRDDRSDRGNRPASRDDRPWKREDRPDRDSRPWKRDDRPANRDNRPWKRDDRPASRKPWSGEDGERPARRYEGQGGKKGFPGKKNMRGERSGDYPRYDAPRATGAVRLNRFIANSGICSRREADDLITAGVVSVNGQVVTALGSKVNPEDEVRFNGEVIKGEKKVYIVMNKPKGFVTSLEDPHSDKTVMDLIKGACTERVYPVGRLDKNSVGVLLITNDGELTRKLTHPSYSKRKIYQVSLDKPLTEADMTKIAEGITLEDGPIFADEISCVDGNRREIGIEIHSGRNRIVRRIFESLGYGVQKLDRVYFAGLTKKKLKRGGWRFLTPREVSMLKSGEYE